MTSDAPTSIALVGPGAIGGALAGGLVQVGHQPTLVTRTPFERLRVTWPEGSLDEPSRCTPPPDLQPSDVVIVATKATQNPNITDHLSALLHDESILLIAQNGVDHVRRFADVIRPGVQVVPAIVLLPATRNEPGDIEVGTPSRLSIPAGAPAEVIRDLFAGSFIDIDVTADWTTSAWFKLMLNASSGGLGVLTQRGSEVAADEGAQELLLAMMEEVAAVGRAEGANLADDLPGQMVRYQAKNAGGHTSSIVLDRIAGVPTEWRERNQVVVDVAAEHGIDVPVNRAVATLMRLSEPDGADRG